MDLGMGQPHLLLNFYNQYPVFFFFFSSLTPFFVLFSYFDFGL